LAQLSEKSGVIRIYDDNGYIRLAIDSSGNVLAGGSAGSGASPVGGVTVSTDGTFSSNTDSVVPSQKAVGTYVGTYVTAHGGGGNPAFTPADATVTLLPYVYMHGVAPITYVEGPWLLSTPSTTAYTNQIPTTTVSGTGKLNDGVVGLEFGTISTYNLSVGSTSTGSNILVQPICDLGSALQPSSIRIYGMQASGTGIYTPTRIKVEYSDDNSTWSTLEDRTGIAQGTGVGIWEARFTPASAHRYWRISCYNSNTSNWVLLTEVRFIK